MMEASQVVCCVGILVATAVLGILLNDDIFLHKTPLLVAREQRLEAA